MALEHYTDLVEIGRGGAGVVFRARSADGTVVAVKLLGRQTEAALARFEREQRLHEQLGEKEGFVPFLEAGDSPRGPYLVMPFVPGGTLRARLDEGPLGVEETIALARRLSAALGRAHRAGIVHRDLKPENVLFSRQGLPLVADLGLAKHFKTSGDAASGTASISLVDEFRGTPGYMPHEQMCNARDVAAPADVFALGCVLYECLAGRSPFPGDSAIEVMASVSQGTFEPLAKARPDAPAWLAATVERTLAKEAAARFQDGRAIFLALEAGEASAEKRRALVVVTALAATLVLVLAVGLAVLRPASAPPEATPGTTAPPPGKTASPPPVSRPPSLASQPAPTPAPATPPPAPPEVAPPPPPTLTPLPALTPRATPARFLYAANSADCAIDQLTIDPATGKLTQVDAVTTQRNREKAAAPPFPWTLAADPDGKFLFCASLLMETTTQWLKKGGDVTSYAIDSITGRLSLAGHYPVQGPALAVSPSGRFLLTVDEAHDKLLALTVGLNGELTLAATASLPDDPIETVSKWSAIAVDPRGHFVYAINRQESVISIFALSETGALAAVGAPVPVGPNARSPTFTPDGRFLLILTGTLLEAFAVDGATGAIAVGGSTATTKVNPSSIGMHPTGRYAFVSNYDPKGSTRSGTTTFAIDPKTGTVSEVRGAAFTSVGLLENAVIVDACGRFVFSGEFRDARSLRFDPTGGLSPVSPGLPGARAGNVTKLLRGPIGNNPIMSLVTVD